MALEETAAAVAEIPSLRPAGPAPGARKWLAIGTGAGIEIAGGDLRIVVVRVRPSGVTVVAETGIADFETRPAAEWGAEFAAFAKRAQVPALAATVLLPRREVVVRTVSLPGVDPKELGSAVSWQVDALHPYADQPVAHGWARLGETEDVLVGIARQELVDRLANLFSEAGIKLAGFTFSAAVLYSASRILVAPPTAFLAVNQPGNGEDAVLEAYGESPARPVFSTWFDDLPEGVEPRAVAEMRAGGELPTGCFADLLPPLRPAQPPASALAAAAAIANACPRLSLSANLLPVERRSTSARWIYLPTAILAGLLAIAAGVLAYQPGYHERHYLDRLAVEIRKLEPRAQQAAKFEAAAESARRRIELLDEFRRRSQADADALRELTNLIPAPGWVTSLALSRTEVQVSGEADQPASLIKTLDGSALFRDSSFSNSMTRSGTGSSEGFVIRTYREGPGTGEGPKP